MGPTQGGDGGGQDRAGSGRDGGHPERPCDLVLGGREVRLGSGDRRRDRVGVADEHLASLGQADQPPLPLEQQDARFDLEDPELLGDGGGGDGHRLRSRPDGPAPRDLAQHL